MLTERATMRHFNHLAHMQLNDTFGPYELGHTCGILNDLSFSCSLEGPTMFKVDEQ